jgi:hypothetical protein
MGTTGGGASPMNFASKATGTFQANLAMIQNSYYCSTVTTNALTLSKGTKILVTGSYTLTNINVTNMAYHVQVSMNNGGQPSSIWANTQCASSSGALSSAFNVFAAIATGSPFSTYEVSSSFSFTFTVTNAQACSPSCLWYGWMDIRTESIPLVDSKVTNRANLAALQMLEIK